jgi:hypothetical protein
VHANLQYLRNKNYFSGRTSRAGQDKIAQCTRKSIIIYTAFNEELTNRHHSPLSFDHEPIQWHARQPMGRAPGPPIGAVGIVSWLI